MGGGRRRALTTALALAWGLSIAGLGPAALAGAATDAARITDERKVSDRVVELTIATPAFAAPTKVQVTLPTGYDAAPARRWPVTYFTAGTQNRYNAFNDFLDGERLTSAYPSLIVSPDANSGYWSDWYNGGAFGTPRYETFVIDQLIPLIDAHFRTLADRAHRAILGISMGGYGALMLAAHHPDLFAAAASLSGAVDSNLPVNGSVLSISSTFDGAPVDAIYGPRATQEVRWRGHNPVDLAENLRGMNVQVRTANGTLDPAIGEGTSPNDNLSCVVEGAVYAASVSLHAQLAARKVPHGWKDYGPGCHTPANFTREVLDTLAAFAPILAGAPAPPRTFAYRSILPRFGVWGWTVRADPDRALEFLDLKGAGAGGATFTGSGTTTVTTAALFPGLRAVDVRGNGESGTVTPDRAGRLRFTVDLGQAHPDQEYTAGSRSVGDGSDGYRNRRTVTFAPHARLILSRAERTRAGARVCVRALGPRVSGLRLALLGAGGKRAGPVTRATAGGKARCVRLVATGRTDGRLTVRATGTDRFHHGVAASAPAR